MDTPNRVFRYQDPDGVYTVTEQEILDTYCLWWTDRMRQLGRAHLVNEKNCVEDWITGHWAFEVTDAQT